jgi:hypothetical protein
MDDVSRVTAADYVPTDCASLLCTVYMSDSSDTADILRARIKTMGVEEHFFEKEVGAPGAHKTYANELSSQPHPTGTRGVKDFWIYDVPGSRGSRQTWYVLINNLLISQLTTPFTSRIPFFDMGAPLLFPGICLLTRLQSRPSYF